MRKRNIVKIPGVKDFYSDNVGKVDVDPGIAETCKILCSKGYTTIASCQGHFIKFGFKSAHGYIWMNDRAGIPQLRAPKGVYQDTDSQNRIIRWKPRTRKGLNRIHKELLKWAKAL